MLIVGLTGGIGCGKTFVANALADLGCHVIEADQLGHEVLLPAGEAFEPTVATFGSDILGANGTIDRSRLAAKVFGNQAALAKLNAIVHPAVRRLALKRMAEIGEKDPRAIVIYVAAILLESGAYREVGKIIVVDCSRERQLERALKRPGAKQADVEARLERQMPAEERNKRADYRIDANGTTDETLRQTRLIWEDLVRQA